MGYQAFFVCTSRKQSDKYYSYPKKLIVFFQGLKLVQIRGVKLILTYCDDICTVITTFHTLSDYSGILRNDSTSHIKAGGYQKNATFKTNLEMPSWGIVNHLGALLII